MYISSGGGSGKGSTLPNQQSNSTSTTPTASHNANLQQPIFQSPNMQSVVMPPTFHAPYMPRQPASQIYSSTPQIHFPQTQMPPNFTSYSYFFTNSILSTQHRPSIIPNCVTHNPNPLTLPSVNIVSPNMPQQGACQSQIHPPPLKTVPVKKRSHALPIINPITKKNIFEEFELSKTRGLDIKQQSKSLENEVASKPCENSCVLSQKSKTNFVSEASKEIKVVKEDPLVEAGSQSNLSNNVEFKQDKSISTVKNDEATQDFGNISDNNTEIGKEQTTKKQDADSHCLKLQNENQITNQSPTNYTIEEQVSKEWEDISQVKSMCGKPVESCSASEANAESTKGPKVQSTISVERPIESNKKQGTGRQRKKSQNSESVEKRISDNSKKKNYREEELKKKDRVENKNIPTDLTISRKPPKSKDSVDCSLYPNTKEVKSLHPVKVEAKQISFPSDTERNIQSKENKETSTEINKEFKKPNALPSKLHSGIPAQKSLLPPKFYKEGQWSPFNEQGKKSYDIQQLRLLRQIPLSNVKPTLKKINGILHDDKSSTNTKSYKNSQAFVNNESTSLSSLQFSNKSATKIGSNQTKQINKPSKPGMIHVRLSLREDVKLSETENAWRPSHLKKLSDNTNPGDREKEVLFRKVRGILNKLTPDKFDALMEEIMKLQIDTSEKINGVMMLVFEKAIDEPNFSASYARLCQRVADKNGLYDQSDKSDSKKTSGFKTALLDKTEREFRENVIDFQVKNATLNPTFEELRNCTDLKRKQELQIFLEEQEYLLRKRSCGTVCFIGELFKMNMLTSKIINGCVHQLLDSGSEEKLECLCKLLTTVGKKFEVTGKDTGQRCLDDVIKKIQNIVDRKVEGCKISNRVRFMLQDVIDLRRNKWVTSHRSDSQKVIEPLQIEQQNTGNATYNSQLSKRGERTLENRSSSNSSSDHNSRSKSIIQSAQEENWFKHNKGSQKVDTNKLLIKPIFQTENTIKLGHSSQYKWPREQMGSTHTTIKEHFSTQMPDVTLKRTKNFPETGTARQTAKKGITSSLPSIAKSNSQTNLLSKTITLPKKIKSATQVTSALSVCPKDILSTPMDISEKDNKVINDCLNRLVDAYEEETIESCFYIWSEVSKKLHWALIYNIFADYLHLTKTKPATRKILSKIIFDLMQKKYLVIEDFQKGYLEFSKIANEIVIDVPEAWKYIFEFIGHFILKGTMSIRLFWNQHLQDNRMGKRFLKNCISYFVREMDYKYMQQLWQSEKFEWTEFLHERDVSKFIEENKFQFLNSKENQTFPTNTSNTASTVKRIKEFLRDNNTTEDVMEYLNRNNMLVNNEFIRNLTLALCDSTIVRGHKNNSFNQHIFRKRCIPLLRRYIDSKEDNELTCLSTIADFAQGFDDIDNILSDIFCELYEADVISEDSFLKWRDINKIFLDKYAPLLGLRRFFDSLNTEASDEN